MDNIALEREEKKQTVSVFPESKGIVPNPNYATTVAARADIALGTDSPGVDVIKNAVLQGDTERFKQLARNREMMQFEDTKMSLAREVLQQSEGRAPTAEESDAFMSLSLAQAEAGNAATIIEKNFAKKYVTTAVTADLEDDTLDNASMENDADANRMLDIAESGVTRNVIAQNKLTEITDQLGKMGLADKAWDFAENMIPFKQSWNFHDVVEKAPTESILTGNNLGEQIAYLHTLPPEEFKIQFEAAVEELRSRNIYDALSFAQAAIAFSSSDQFWANAQDVVDTAGVLAKPATSLGKAVFKGVGRKLGPANLRLAKKLQGAVEGAVEAPMNIPAAAAKAGHTATAAKATVLRNVVEGRLMGQNIKDLKQLEQTLPNVLAPNKTFVGNTALPPVAVSRLEELAVARNERMLDFLLKPNLIERITPDEIALAVDEAAASIRKTFNHRAHNVVNVIHNPAEKSIANVHSVTVQFGKADGTFFETAQKANRFAASISQKTDDYSIKQYPGGFAVEVTKNVDETSGGLRSLAIKTEDKHPENFQTKMWAAIRSANDQVSAVNRQQRSVGVMTEEYMANVIHDLVQPLKGISRKHMRELEDVVNEAQTIFNPNTKKTGVYYNNVSEFEVAFQKSTGHLPTAEQVDAYFTYVDLNDLDYAVTAFDTYKQKARMGIEAFETKIDGKDVKFEGKEVKQLPFGSKDYFSVRVFDSNGKVTKKFNSKFHKLTDKAEMEKLIASGGYKLIQSADGPLRFGEDSATFILVKDAKRSRVSIMSAPRQEGGRQAYKDRLYVKQGEVRLNKDGGANYHGDRTLYSAASEAEARAFTEDFNKLISLWKTDKNAAVNLIRTRMPFTVQEFFADVNKGVINTDVPVSVVRSGQTTADVADYSKKYSYFNNLTASEHNLNARLTGRFMGERADHIIDTVKREANGVYSTTPSPLIKPMQSLGGTLGGMVRTRVMNDYTISSVHNWYKQFSNVLDVTKEEMDVFGVDFLMNPVYKQGASALEKQAAENVRVAIANLVSNSTDVAKRIAAKKDRIVESVYGRFGPKAANWVSEDLLPTVTNADVYMRSFAFHSKLGFFNPIQLYLQASAFTNAVAIGGRSGVKGAVIYPAFQAAVIKAGKGMTSSIAKKVSKFGWSEQHFQEAVDGYRLSGMHVVGKDVGYLDDMRGADIRPLRSSIPGVSEVGDFITEKGTIFFRNGERIPRMIAYTTSYDQWRKANPKALFDRRSQAIVLDRAKLLAGNMTRDSNARWQRGWPSLATQFFAYQARMSEMFIGKRLTGAEKARLFAMNSLMYGAPVGVAGTTAVMPWRDYLKDKLFENGIEVDDTWGEVAMDGVLSTLTEYMTGYDFDIGGRYGPGGITTFYDLWNGDTEIRELFMGASGSIVGDTIMSAKPFVKALWSAVDLDDQTVYPVLVEDVLQVLRNISTVDSAIKMHNYTKVGAWISRNGTKLTNIDGFEAWVAAVTGIGPDRVGETFNKLDAIQAIKERKKQLSKDWVKTIKKAMTQEDVSSKDLMLRTVKAEMIANGMSNIEVSRVYKQALDEQPLDEAIEEQFTKSVKDYVNRIKK